MTIHVLSFDRPTAQSERFYFIEMSTLQATELLPKNLKIVSCKIIATKGNEIYLDNQKAEGFKSIGDFHTFFSTNPEYYIHNCEIEMESGMIVGSHDDGEVTIQFPNNSPDQIFIIKIFEKYGLDKKLIDLLKSKPGNYLAVDDKCNVIAEYKDFDDYLAHGT